MPHTRQEWEIVLIGLLNYTNKHTYITTIKKWAEQEGFDNERTHIYVIESLKLLNGNIHQNGKTKES